MRLVLRFTMSCVLALLAVGCSRAGENLPPSFYIAQGSNLYEATAFLCNGDIIDERQRGRWRRWENVNPEIAEARTTWNPKSGTTVIIQAGDYNVPRNLCASETNIAGILLLAFFVAVVLGMTAQAMRKGSSSNTALTGPVSDRDGHRLTRRA